MASGGQWHQQIDRLYGDHQRWLVNWFRRKLGCHQRADDLTHDTFMRLLVRREAITVREPRAFLTTLANRVLSNHWRREQVEVAYLKSLAALPEEQAPSPEEHALLLEALHQVDRMLGDLPLPVKRAFLYAQLDGLTHQAIADKLNLSISTVKRYLIRASAQCYFALESA
ncbi:sigma-70 family RNA polymerase sigma factor [Alloalcanivorax xenomutans]|uniref:sigma-70 family RNA polymerase sigma factor n=1 Tax=Alloalcanivorax xenomutans TaxID=1094342 RepID=UPI00047AF42B